MDVSDFFSYCPLELILIPFLVRSQCLALFSLEMENSCPRCHKVACMLQESTTLSINLLRLTLPTFFNFIQYCDFGGALGGSVK